MQKTWNHRVYEDLVGWGLKPKTRYVGSIRCSDREFVEAILFRCCHTLLVQS
jgi:hypothetical protein